MKHHLEIEYKSLLSAADYQRLLPEFSHLTPISQTNYYIDSPDWELKGHKCSLRLRIMEDRAELTLKIPQTIGNQEYNQAIDSQAANQLIKDFCLPQGPIADLLRETVQLDKLTIWGSLHTLRYETDSPIGLLALDKNSYADQIDYELEVEVTDDLVGKKAFEDYLDQRHIPYRYAQSKVARTAARLTQRNS